ncbi:MAG: hypothetical protein MUF49_05100 [Oculatellaceae cyanobacterium Prado106]|jgi:hypothetical protein|nr:hypothetical protein [Oculatellaceae cyanobacterium Prado106]
MFIVNSTSFKDFPSGDEGAIAQIVTSSSAKTSINPECQQPFKLSDFKTNEKINDNDKVCSPTLNPSDGGFSIHLISAVSGETASPFSPFKSLSIQVSVGSHPMTNRITKIFEESLKPPNPEETKKRGSQPLKW